MPGFVFQLEGVLRHRRNVERQCQRQLALAQAQMQELRDQLRGLDLELQDANADLRNNRLVGRLDLSFLAAHRRFVASMQAKGMLLVQKMALIQRQVDEGHAALAAAAKARKVIEKLREKHLERWQSEENRREALEMDEIGTQLASRRLNATFEAMDDAGDLA